MRYWQKKLDYRVLGFYNGPRGDTPLVVSAKNHHWDAHALLLEYGADSSIRDSSNNMAIDYLPMITDETSGDGSYPNHDTNTGNNRVLVGSVALKESIEAWPTIQYTWNHMILPLTPSKCHGYTLPSLPILMAFPLHAIATYNAIPIVFEEPYI